MSHIAYYRISSKGQSIDSQKSSLTHANLIEHEFKDEGVSGAMIAANRPGFAAMMKYIRAGDTLHVYAIDRLGRDAIDVQTTIRDLLKKGVTIEINNVGQIADTGVGKMIVALMAQMAELERERINERTTAGKKVAKVTFAATGRTHKGKASLGGRPVKANAATIKQWRTENKKSISETAAHFSLSDSTVKRYCAE